MTICIAAICEGGHTIVTASDREFGVGFTSAELDDAKIMPLFMGANPGNWAVGIAGTVSHSTEVMGAMRLMESELVSCEWHDIQNILQKRTGKSVSRKPKAKFLPREDGALRGFKKRARHFCPLVPTPTWILGFPYLDLGASLIVAGFTSDDLPAVLTAANPGIVTDHSKLGFWCIGSGSTLAQTNPV